ncbi:MAG TPA: ELM1/GtrOC1 family putative glycosyltransferase, partial [Alphaproteobacteria bacterium]|nr:ELM1/GtrOC1 family putative glycosyltransferase [Alphaproteobacteria bacterium]
MRSSGGKRFWLFLGKRAGDNRQIVLLAEALQLPFDQKPLRFNWASSLPNALLGPSLISLTAESRRSLKPPWPTAVIAAGRRAVPAALWVREQSGTTRLIHIGRPWAPLAWFDLVITTPQFGLGKHPNVLSNLMPLTSPRQVPEAEVHDFVERYRSLPRPWTGVLVGGNSRPIVLDSAAATRLGHAASEVARSSGGSLLVVAGPRT